MVDVQVLKAVIDGNKEGSKLKIDKRSAKALEAKGYVKVLSKETDEKGTSAPKKSAPKKAKPKPTSPKKKAAPKKDAPTESKSKDK